MNWVAIFLKAFGELKNIGHNETQAKTAIWEFRLSQRR
jgi:hypothetical protein